MLKSKYSENALFLTCDIPSCDSVTLYTKVDIIRNANKFSFNESNDTFRSRLGILRFKTNFENILSKNYFIFKI